MSIELWKKVEELQALIATLERKLAEADKRITNLERQPGKR